MKKITNRQIQAQNTRNQVYKTAVELMSEKGFENITIAEICEEAGVSVGTYYNYFKSKNDILDEVFKLADDYFYNVVANHLKEGNSEDKIIRFYQYYVNYNVDRGFDFIKHLFNVNNKIFIVKGRYMQTVLQNIIEEGQEKGEVCTEMTSEKIVEYLFIAVRGIIYDWCLHDGEYDLSEFADMYVVKLVKIFIC